jgi:hypothetical protein
VERLQDRLDDVLVPRFRGTDEVVVGDPEPAPGVAKGRRDLVGIALRRHARLRRRLGDVVAVLVGAGQEIHPIARQPVVAAHGIGHDGRARMSGVRVRVDVVDRRGQVEGARGHVTKTAARQSRLI